MSPKKSLRVLAHQKYRRPRSCPHLIDHIFGARNFIICKPFLLNGAKEHHRKTRPTKNEKMTIALAEGIARSPTDISDDVLERWCVFGLVLFFGLELHNIIVYKLSTAFVDFNFTFLFIHQFTCQILILLFYLFISSRANMMNN